MYKTRFGMTSFAKDKRFVRSEWLCKCGEAKEEESHLMSGLCEVYGEIRRNYSDLNDDKQLVDFFNEVLARRYELEEKEKNDIREE